METVPSTTGSFAKRRKLFKDVWDTNETYKVKVNPMKPPIVRTARIGDHDIISKRKKQRIRNLRTVCKQILHFCDREETDIYGRMASARAEREIEDFFKTFKPKLESLPNETEENVKNTHSGYMSTDIRNETSNNKNACDHKFSNNASAQNKVNKVTSTYPIKTAYQGRKQRAFSNIANTKNITPRQVYAMHTINIPRLL